LAQPGNLNPGDDADDMVRLAVENDVLSEDGGTGAEIIAPNLIAQNGDMALAGTIFFGGRGYA
jgi:hypothetical protein